MVILLLMWCLIDATSAFQAVQPPVLNRGCSPPPERATCSSVQPMQVSLQMHFLAVEVHIRARPPQKHLGKQGQSTVPLVIQ